mgnify:CR=1 FL=1
MTGVDVCCGGMLKGLQHVATTKDGVELNVSDTVGEFATCCKGCNMLSPQRLRMDYVAAAVLVGDYSMLESATCWKTRTRGVFFNPRNNFLCRFPMG